MVQIGILYRSNLFSSQLPRLIATPDSIPAVLPMDPTVMSSHNVCLIEYFNDRGSNVPHLASLDVSKTLDRANHFQLSSIKLR